MVLKQDKIIFTHGKIVNTYIVCERNLWHLGYDDYLTLEKNYLFRAVKLVKILILISINILAMLLDLIGMQLFVLAMDLIKM